MAGTKRCFVAIVPGESVRAVLAEAARGVDLPYLKLTPAENLHITVKFLGNVIEEDVPALIEAMQAAAREHEAFELTDPGVLVLPELRKPRVLAAGYEGGETMTGLHEAIEDVAEAGGFERESRQFRAHVTLGRFKVPRKKKMPRIERPVLDLSTEPIVADRLVFMESQLDRTGPTYTTLAELPLGGGVR